MSCGRNMVAWAVNLERLYLSGSLKLRNYRQEERLYGHCHLNCCSYIQGPRRRNTPSLPLRHGGLKGSVDIDAAVVRGAAQHFGVAVARLIIQ